MIGYYKLPKINYFEEVARRHDPITIYTYERDPIIESQITTAMAPFARSNDGLLGELLGRGVAITPELSQISQQSVGKMAAIDISEMLVNTK